MRHEISIESILSNYSSNFRILDVISCLQDYQKRDQAGDEALRCVSNLGYIEDRTLTEQGVIELCLLGTELFQFDGAFTRKTDQILNVRLDPPRSFTCRNRPKLIETLAILLLAYEKYYIVQRIEKPVRREDQTQKAWACVQQTLGVYLSVRAKQRRATHRTGKHLSGKKIKNACKTLATAVKAVTLEDYQRIGQHELKMSALFGSFHEYDPHSQFFIDPETFEGQWLAAMYAAFTDYGPSREYYPQDAIFPALAVICRHFALKKGDHKKVGRRLLKQWQRHNKAAAKRKAGQAAWAIAGVLRRRQRHEEEAAKLEAERAAKSTE